MFLLRLALSIFLIAQLAMPGSAQNINGWHAAIAAPAGALLAVGLWTPFSAALAAALELWIAATTDEPRGAHLLAAAIALSLIGLGPGAWSVDARLFGRRRISVTDR